MHVGGGGVTRFAAVHHQNAAAGPGKDQSGGQAGGAPADDNDIKSVHACKAEAARHVRLQTLPFPGIHGHTTRRQSTNRGRCPTRHTTIRITRQA